MIESESEHRKTAFNRIIGEFWADYGVPYAQIQGSIALNATVNTEAVAKTLAENATGPPPDESSLPL